MRQPRDLVRFADQSLRLEARHVLLASGVFHRVAFARDLKLRLLNRQLARLARYLKILRYILSVSVRDLQFAAELARIRSDIPALCGVGQTAPLITLRQGSRNVLQLLLFTIIRTRSRFTRKRDVYTFLIPKGNSDSPIFLRYGISLTVIPFNAIEGIVRKLFLIRRKGITDQAAHDHRLGKLIPFHIDIGNGKGRPSVCHIIEGNNIFRFVRRQQKALDDLLRIIPRNIRRGNRYALRILRCRICFGILQRAPRTQFKVADAVIYRRTLGVIEDDLIHPGLQIDGLADRVRAIALHSDGILRYLLPDGECGAGDRTIRADRLRSPRLIVMHRIRQVVHLPARSDRNILRDGLVDVKERVVFRIPAGKCKSFTLRRR